MSSVRAAASILAALLLGPLAPAAQAWWTTPRPVAPGSPLPVAPSVVHPRGDDEPLSVLLPGGERQVVPGSEDALDTDVAVGAGLVVVTWATDESCPAGDFKAQPCPSVRASIWRRGDAPPPAPVLDSTDARYDDVSPSAAVGDDGTVLVAWDGGDEQSVMSAVGRGPGPLSAPVKVARGGGWSLGVETVRGRAQLAWSRRNGRVVGVTEAQHGRLGRPRVVARVADPDFDEGVFLLRSPRGDRLLWWHGKGHTFKYRIGAPRRGMRPVVRLLSRASAVALGPRGHYAVATQRSFVAGVPMRVVRGRTSGRTRRDRLPAAREGTTPDAAHLQVDGRGHTYALWVSPIRASSVFQAAGGLMAAAAPWGEPFERARLLSERACQVELGLRRGGGAVAQWGCHDDDTVERSYHR